MLKKVPELNEGKNFMKRACVSPFFGVSLMLLCQALCPVLANATAKIAFTSTRDGNSEIYIMNSDGSQPVNLTRHPARDLAPNWSPTGTQIVFNSHRDGERDIYIMDADGTNVRKVFKTLAYREYPVWSPDGKWIAYTQVPDWALYIATIDGRNVKRVASTGWLGGSPAWAPNGTQIGFTLTQAIHPGSYQLQLVNPQTGVQKTIHPEPWLRMTGPAWSPNGDQIAFGHIPVLRKDLEKGTIYTMNRFGRELKQVVPEKGGRASKPAWSPAGDELLYQQKVGNRVQLLTINLRTRKSKKLTRLGTNFGADWLDSGMLHVHPGKRALTTTWAKIKKE